MPSSSSSSLSSISTTTTTTNIRLASLGQTQKIIGHRSTRQTKTTKEQAGTLIDTQNPSRHYSKKRK